VSTFGTKDPAANVPPASPLRWKSFASVPPELPNVARATPVRSLPNRTTYPRPEKAALEAASGGNERSPV
jgi:hypothetical protein